jgi:AcrR family transcriptional regulator
LARATAARAVAPADGRRETEQRFLDAAERLLVSVGYAAITTRRLAEEAGANAGLVHYYFGSMEEVFFQVLERFTSRLMERQRPLYQGPGTYLEKWRAAMSYLESDRPYQKVWWELQAMAWNRPEYRPRVARVLEAWSGAMRGAVAGALERYHLTDGPLSADDWVTLILTLNEGLILERLAGITRGHDQLLAAIDRWLESKERAATGGQDGKGGRGGKGGKSGRRGGRARA